MLLTSLGSSIDKPSSCLIRSIWQSWSSPILEILSSLGLQDTTFSWFSSYLTSHFFSVFFCWLLLCSFFHFGKILGFLLFIISSLIMLSRYILSNTNHTLMPPKCRSPVWLSLLNTNLVHPTLSQLLGSLIAMSKIKLLGFPGGAVVENLPANAEDTGSSPGLGRSHMPRSN